MIASFAGSMDYSLYVATDSAFFPDSDEAFLAEIEACLEQGVSVLQLRLKKSSARHCYEIGCRLRDITRRFQVPLIINDRLDLAMAVDADGVHLGRQDLPPAEARRLMPRKLIGYSVNTNAHLLTAEAANVDYIGVGPVFASSTKNDTGPVLGLEGVQHIVSRTTLPCVAIGNISINTVADVIKTKVAGVCLISAVFNQPDPALAVHRFREVIDNHLNQV